jgi:preprotein translocase subunit SecG
VKFQFLLFTLILLSGVTFAPFESHGGGVGGSGRDFASLINMLFIIIMILTTIFLLLILIIYIYREELGKNLKINLDKIDKKLDEMEIWVKEKFNIK